MQSLLFHNDIAFTELEGGHPHDQWLCNTISVGIQGIVRKVEFPVYDWIENEMTILPGSGLFN